MRQLAPEFPAFVDSLVAEVEQIEGFLTPREIEFLALLAAYPTADGEILEIGSFKGKSTITLAKAAGLGDSSKVHAVDPMNSPSVTDPNLKDGETSFADFKKNVERHDAADKIELHQVTSAELAENWSKPLRLLWIDGDHTYEGARVDFEGFSRHLCDGAIVAMHDVLHVFEGALRVFVDDILRSPHFGACGCAGSIGWAQFHKDAENANAFRRSKLRLYQKLRPLVPYVSRGNNLRGLDKLKYKLLRSRVPRAVTSPDDWIANLTIDDGTRTH